jgi:hypothetical protein
MFTDTFTGIDPGNVLFFITAQFIGAFLGFGINKILDKPS